MAFRIKLNRGSVLVFSLMVLAVMLSAALTIATVSVTNRQSVGVSSESTQSFQVANSGAELAAQKIYKGNNATLIDLAASMGAACNANTITKNNFSGGTVVMTFFDNNGIAIACNDVDWRSKVVRMKSEGTASGTTRVIETAVAAAATAERIKCVKAPGDTVACVDTQTGKLCLTAIAGISNWNCPARGGWGLTGTVVQCAEASGGLVTCVDTQTGELCLAAVAGPGNWVCPVRGGWGL